jgi:hypothetical protein
MMRTITTRSSASKVSVKSPKTSVKFALPKTPSPPAAAVAKSKFFKPKVLINSSKTDLPSSTYKYSTLSACLSAADSDIDDNSGSYNFFAVIVDATYPHRAQFGKSDRFTCTLRIIDPEQYLSPESGVIDACTLVMFANKFEDLPVSQRVGDIIRVHRATVQEYRGAKHFTACVNYNAAWALFSPCPKDNRQHVLLGFVEDKEDAGGREFKPM